MGKHFLRAGWLLGLLACVACGAGLDGDGSGTGDGSQVAERPGLGYSKEAPQGVPYALPTGLELAQPLTGKKYECVKPGNEQRKEVGSGTQVVLCVELRNTTSGSIRVVFPPGLIFVSADLETQNGLLLHSLPVEVPAQQTVLLGLHLYCLNENRAGSGPRDTFSLGPVTQDTLLREVIALVQDKQLPVEESMAVQNAIDNVTNGPGLTASDREALAKLPAKSAGTGTGTEQ